MSVREVDPLASSAVVPKECRKGPVDGSAIPTLWRPPPAPAFVRVSVIAILVLTLFGAPILLRANGQEPNAVFMGTYFILLGEAVVLWFVFAMRCAYLESIYAPTQRYYRNRLLIGLIVLVAVIVILFLLMGRCSKNSKANS